MKEVRSIYEYISENIDLDGTLAASCNLKDYMLNTRGEYDEDEYLKGEEDDPFAAFDEFFSNKSKDVVEVDFKTPNIMMKSIEELDSTELEEYLEEKYIGIKEIYNIFNEKIADTVSKKDNDEVIAFIMKNIKNTKSPRAMYAYLVMLSFLNIKDRVDVKKVVLKIALMTEFTFVVNEYVIDKLDYPDYARFFLAKRVEDRGNKYTLLKSMGDLNNEVRLWLVTNYFGTESFRDEATLIEKLDILNVMEKWPMDEQLFLCVSNIVANGAHCAKNINLSNLKIVLNKYVEMAEDYIENPKVFENVSDLFMYFNQENFGMDLLEFSEEREVLKNFMLKDKYLNELKRRVQSRENGIFDVTYPIVIALKQREMYLELFNILKAKPIENIHFISLFKDDEELYKTAVKIVDEAIDWEGLTGNLETSSDIFDKAYIRSFILHLKEEKESLSYCYRALFANNSYVRWEALMKINSIMRYEAEPLSDELVSKLKNLLEVENNIKNRAYIKEQLGLKDIEIGETGRLARLNFVDKIMNLDTEEESDNVSGEDKEESEEKKPLNLNEPGVVWNLPLEDLAKGINIAKDRRVRLVGCILDEEVAFVTGDEFGKEYTVKLRKDKNGYMVESMCTCGENSADSMCGHVSATIGLISKRNEILENEKNSEK